MRSKKDQTHQVSICHRMSALKNLFRIERARHLSIAVCVAMLLGAIGAFHPIDWFFWLSQSQASARPASGQIVFIGATEDLTSPTEAHGRTELAGLLTRLEHVEAKRVFIDIPLQRPSQIKADAQLRNTIEESRIVSTVSRYATVSAGVRLVSSSPQITGSAPTVISEEWVDPFGFTRYASFGFDKSGSLVQSFPAALADARPIDTDPFQIDYSIRYDSVPSFTVPEAIGAIDAGKGSELFAGKYIVVGNGGGESGAYAAIPGHAKVPSSMVAILAAETIRAGLPPEIGWFATFVPFALLFGAVCSFARDRQVRFWGYTLALTLLPAWFLISAQLRITAHLSVPIAMVLTYSIMRLWSARNHRASLVDEMSGLPSFRAMEKDLVRRADVPQLSVIVAKIHRFDEVLSILPGESQGEYVRMIANRFRITEEKLTVYSNGGRYLAWFQEVEDEAHLEAHLKGLRAVFAYPLNVDGTAIDVGITFGADSTREANPGRKIASATSAVDKSTESHSPVVLADAASPTDRMWNISLQAKIDAALKSGQIYVVYQPQFHLPTEQVFGFEALVRWNDPERGPIAPSYFIEQCEHAGRMDALTQKVFQDTIDAIQSSAFANGPYRFSMNVSATLLNDDRVVELLKDTLAGSNVARSRITLEITETARITDYDKARGTLRALQDLGVRTSVDDFGVGAASLETLLRLPFDELKIDRAFISRMKDDVKARRIVETLIHLSNGLNLEVVAEGVEDQQTLDILRTMGCEGVQGFALARPGTLSALEHFLTPDSKPRRIALRVV